MAKGNDQPKRRALLRLAVLFPWLAGCHALAGPPRAAGDPRLKRFRGIGLVLVVDAVPGAEMRGVAFYDDREIEIYSSSLAARKNRGIMALGGQRVPLTVRVVWREGAGWDEIKKVWTEGTVAGDYTIPIAERIPDSVLEDIRKKGGALRLKFRLKPDGVLFGWDIQRNGAGSGYVFRYDMPGGDFKEARIVNGKAVEPGWQILGNGQKILTDY